MQITEVSYITVRLKMSGDLSRVLAGFFVVFAMSTYGEKVRKKNLIRLIPFLLDATLHSRLFFIVETLLYVLTKHSTQGAFPLEMEREVHGFSYVEGFKDTSIITSVVKT